MSLQSVPTLAATMSNAAQERAVCRGCGMTLRGEPYYTGGRAYHPASGARCPHNYYGGYVCSETCDRRASLALEQSMPGHGYGQTRVGADAEARIRSNWPTGGAR